MKEGEAVAQIDQRSRAAICDSEWAQEQRLDSSEYVLIRGMIGGEQKGALSASFEIKRELEDSSGELFETERSASLKSISVWPAFQRKGLGTALLNELEKQAREFRASRITGIISSGEYEEKPWLKEYYEERGYTLSQKGEGWQLVKELSSPVI